MDPQAPQQPNAEPTPGSPAPTQTSPVTPGTPSATPTPPAAPTPPGTPPAKNGNKKLLWAIVGAVIIVVALVFLFLSPWSPFVSAAPKGPKILLGKKQYIYPCAVFDKQLVGKQLDIKLDANKENVEEYYAFDPANTKDKEVDMTKRADTAAVNSICTLKLDRIQEGEGEKQTTSFINVGLSLEQFPEDDKASEAFDSDKQLVKGAKTVPSFNDNSYYGAPRQQQSGALVVQSKVLHKNLLVTITAPTDDGDTDGSKTVAKLEAVFKDIISRIDKGEGLKHKNFNKANQINGNKFVDACDTINFAKIVQAMGNGTELYTPRVNSTQAYAPDNNRGQTPSQLASTCAFSFRTQTEIDSQKNTSGNDGQKLSYSERFPHYLSTQVAATESKEKAQEYLSKVKAEAQKNAQESQQQGQSEDGTTEVKDIQLGDKAIKMTLRQEFPGQEPGDASEGTFAELYYIAKGPYLFVFSTSYTEQAKPFATKSHSLNDDQIKKIFKELSIAPKRAR